MSAKPEAKPMTPDYFELARALSEVARLEFILSSGVRHAGKGNVVAGEHGSGDDIPRKLPDMEGCQKSESGLLSSGCSARPTQDHFHEA